MDRLQFKIRDRIHAVEQQLRRLLQRQHKNALHLQLVIPLHLKALTLRHLQALPLHKLPLRPKKESVPLHSFQRLPIQLELEQWGGVWGYLV